MAQYKKKTVVIHPELEQFIRYTQAMLINADIDATYSAALNFMLVGIVNEAADSELSDKSRDLMWDFAADNKTVEELNLRERLDEVRNTLRRLEGHDEAAAE